MRRAAALVLVAALATAGAGCGDDEDSTDRVRPQETGPSPGAGVTDRDADVAIRDFEFVPSQASIPVGASVEWTNNGDIAHTVTWSGGEGERFDSGRMQPGENFKRTFDEPGARVRYHCSIHPRMRGTVEVGVMGPDN